MKIQSFLLLITLVAVRSLLAQNPIQIAINQFVASPEFANAGISFLAVDIDNGQTIASYNPNNSFPTASTAKLFSTASAIDILGPGYRPETKLYIDGVIDVNGVLNGNLWIRGGGDVSLGSKYFNEAGHEADFLNIWVDTLKKLGIRTITGAVIADGSEFGYAGAPDGWTWNDMGNYYGAGPSGLAIFDNLLKFTFKTGPAGTKAELIRTFPEVPNMTFHNYILSENVSGDKSFIYGGPYSMDRFGSGYLPINHPGFEVKGSIPDPEFQFAYELLKVLTKNQILVQEGARSVRSEDLQQKNRYNSPNFKLIYTHKGASIQEIATITNMKSINLFAEGLVCMIGYKLTGNGSTAEGLKQIEKYWAARMSLTGLFLEDGSGLSRTNGISARHYCDLLIAMTKSVNHTSFYKTLPVSGKSGTLLSLCKDEPAHGRVVAKSGTMARIKSYAGYINSKTGKRIAFSISANNFNCSSNQVVKKMEKLFNLLAVY